MNVEDLNTQKTPPTHFISFYLHLQVVVQNLDVHVK